MARRLGIAMMAVLAAVPLRGIEPGELGGPEDLGRFWNWWWSDCGPEPLPVPRTERIDLRQIVDQPSLAFIAPANEETPFEHTIHLRKDHTLMVVGVHPEEGEWKTQGRWEMHEGMFFLFFGGSVPGILFKEKEGYFLTNPWSKTLKSKLRTRRDDPGK